VDIAIAVGAARLVLENVPRALWHPVGLQACSRLSAAGYTVETAVIDASKLPGGAPQRRVRGMVIATKQPDGCGLQRAAEAVSRRPRRSMRDEFGWAAGCFYHRHRQSGGKCVYSAQLASPTLRTNCASRPRRETYRRRLDDDGSIYDCRILTVPQLGRVQGFPGTFSWPDEHVRCKCKFCSRGGVTSAGRQIGNAIVPRMASWTIAIALRSRLQVFPRGSSQVISVPPVPVRTSHLGGFGRLLTVKSDASGSQRWGYVYVDAHGSGQLVWGQLAGADAEASALVAFFEMCAVHQAVMAHSADWRGYTVRFGVDSAPVSGSLNSGTSHDSGIMGLLRDISDAMVDGGFTVLSVHVTRNHNSLSDQVTRHRCVQDVAPYLASEGFDAAEFEGSAVSFRISSRVQNVGIWRQLLGQQRQCAGSPPRSEPAQQ
jgi:site-specific DNA-cytosine methylase